MKKPNLPVKIVMAFDTWTNNGDLIRDVVRLGYLKKDDLVLDPTYGMGVWWKRWQPNRLVASDIVQKVPQVDKANFTDLPHVDGLFDVVAFDPPYKLNGTPSEPDERFGVDEVRTWQQRHNLIFDGIDECLRVLRPKGILLIKCQDQVSSGAVRWQSREFSDYAEWGLTWAKAHRWPIDEAFPARRATLIDMLNPLGGRAQPERGPKKDGKPSVQKHARRNGSQLLVLQKAK